MRDLLVALLVFGAIPWIFARPYIGALVYAWLGLMNPHRLTYGFAYSFPFGMVVALTTIVAMLISSEKKRLPWSATFVVWLMFVFWLNVTTFFAILPDSAISEWDRTMKIQLMVLVTMLLVHGRQRITAFVWVIVVSLGYFGVKGGVFALMTGGQYQVMGPMDSFITENNTMGLALIMTLPLMRYLMLVASSKYVRLGLAGMMILTTMSIFSSQSRGAFLAGGTILLFLIMKSRHRARFAMVSIIALPAMLFFMPDAWFDRMASIGSYNQDSSALGRINAWWFAFNLAKDNPITGGGFDVFSKELFVQYAPNPTDHHDAHSIYFEILAEQGFVGLALFLILGVLALRSCGWVIKNIRDRNDLIWAGDLAAMLQVCLIGYATGGAFLGLGYYDLYYDLVALVILLRFHVREKLNVVVPEGDESKLDEPDGSMTPIRNLSYGKPALPKTAGERMQRLQKKQPVSDGNYG
jgi:probable O-glycosylation ligase (exosortase A-associated)